MLQSCVTVVHVDCYKHWTYHNHNTKTPFVKQGLIVFHPSLQIWLELKAIYEQQFETVLLVTG